MIKLGDEYQLRRDIDKIYQKTYNYEDDIWNIYTKDEIHENFYDKDQVDELIGSGGGTGDLSEYVKKTEVDIVLMENGCFKLKLDLEEEEDGTSS